MPDPLRIEVQVDTGPLGALAAASKQVASSVNTMAAQFVASGLSAKEAASALQNLGYSAKEAAAATVAFGSAAGTAATQAAAAATGIGSMDRAMAAATGRMLGMSIGASGLGGALGRVGAASSTLAPLIAVAFPVVAAVALVDVVGKLPNLFEQIIDGVVGWDAASKKAYSEIIDSNIHLLIQTTAQKIQIEALNEIGTKGAAKYALAIKNNADAGKAWAATSAELIHMQQSLTAEIDKMRLAPETVPGAAPLAHWIAESSDKMKQLRKELEEVNKALEIVTRTEQELSSVGAPKAKAEFHVASIAEHTKELEKSSEAGIKLFAALARIASKEEEIALRAKELATEQATWGAEQVAKQADLEEKSWLDLAKIRIDAEQQVFSESQKRSEDAMRNAKAQESLSTAGMGRGPITSALESSGLQQQGAIAQAALDTAAAAAADYKAQLLAVTGEMVRLDTSTADGAKRFAELEIQMRDLQKDFDGAKDAGDRWKAVLTQIAAQQKALGVSLNWQTVGTSMEAAANQGFNAFNSAFTKMLAGGMSFTRLMQTAWTSMVNSFVTSILKMAEQWVTQHLIMAAVAKVTGAAAVPVNAAVIAANQVERQSAIGTAAAESAITAAALGPGAAAAAATATMAALEMITAYAEGGIVSRLHEGEMVLPRSLSLFVQQSAAAASGSLLRVLSRNSAHSH